MDSKNYFKYVILSIIGSGMFSCVSKLIDNNFFTFFQWLTIFFILIILRFILQLGGAK